jgi:hypothetical protein
VIPSKFVKTLQATTSILTFGNYEGGELHFPLLNITLNIEEKDVALFQSHKLEHGNKDTVGIRNSLVFVSHKQYSL